MRESRSDPRPADLDLLHAYLDGTLSAADHAPLHSLLRENAEARRVLRGLATVDAKLEQVAAGDPQTLHLLGSSPDQAASRSGEPRRSASGSKLATAAAGLLLGICCTSIVFAYIAAAPGARAIPVLFESFEHGPAPLTSGMPIVPGVWSGDYSQLADAAGAIAPVDGRAMLRFLRANHEGKPPLFGFMSDVYRIIDLGDFVADMAAGHTRLVVEARFAAFDHDRPNRFNCNVKLDTMSALPSGGGEREMLDIIAAERLEIDAAHLAADRLGDYSPASVQQSLVLPNTGGGWQSLRVELPMSPGTRYVLVKLGVADMQAAAEGRDSCDVEFPGHFVDDVRISLVQNPVR